MIKFFRKIRKDLLSKGKTGKYMKYAVGEIVLVVIGILIALSINNWNEARKESKLEKQLIDVLITDLKSKKKEFVSDLAIGKSIIEESTVMIEQWKLNNQIDTLYLKSLLRVLSEDDWFFNEDSPIHATVSGSGLWRNLPDSLSWQIDNMYRLKFGRIKSAFAKQSEYALNAKLNFLAPNQLLNIKESTSEVKKIIQDNDKKFITYILLFKSGVIRLTYNFETTTSSIDKLIKDLEYYKNNK